MGQRRNEPTCVIEDFSTAAIISAVSLPTGAINFQFRVSCIFERRTWIKTLARNRFRESGCSWIFSEPSTISVGELNRSSRISIEPSVYRTGFRNRDNYVTRIRCHLFVEILKMEQQGCRANSASRNCSFVGRWFFQFNHDGLWRNTNSPSQ